MLLDDFVNKYKGKKVDFDGVYGVQCVDLFRQYAKECLGIAEHTGSCTTTGGAKDLFFDYNKMPIEKKYFSRITNKSYIPGDVAIWNSTEKNKYGHIAIILAELNNCLIVFEQNGFTQNGAEINIRSKDGLLGVLRKK